MNDRVRAAVLVAAQAVPESWLRTFVRRSLEGVSVALCLHRVSSSRRPGEFDPALTIDPDELDALIEFLSGTRARGRMRLTVAFDDGYEDAAHYILSRTYRFPSVEWLYFVCPEKTEHRVGFRWDLIEQKQRNFEPCDRDAVMFGDLDVASENRRDDLAALARHPDYRLADVELCRELARTPRVALGNHTNGHFCQTRLTPAQAHEEYRRSVSDFVRLFGPHQHFAFPFGTPEASFDRTHVAAVRAHGNPILWSTEQRPFYPSERRPGAVLPRYPIDGTRDWRQSAFVIALCAAKWRARGTPFSWPDLNLDPATPIDAPREPRHDAAVEGGRA